jgi:DNA-binding CsgD family transcriptional regulator
MLLATLAHYEVRRGADRLRASDLATRALASGALERVSSHSLYCALDTLRATGDVASGLAACGRALASSRHRGDLFNVGGTLSFRGWLRVEQGREREARLREAVAVLDQSPARLESAKALVDPGSELRRRKDRRAARDLLRSGADLAQDCGAEPVVTHANEDIAATGARPRKAPLSGIAALSASERRVAAMASEGLSNKEIAQSLFVTVKTVEVHVSSAYRKLQVSSRRELPAARGGSRSFAASVV